MLAMLQEFVWLCYSPNIRLNIRSVSYNSVFGPQVQETLVQKHSVKAGNITDHIWGVLGQCDQGQKQSNLPLDLVKKVV